jgi:hypothetical protein
MSQQSAALNKQKSDTGVARVDMKFEVALIRVSDVAAQRSFIQSSGGGSMTTSLWR